MTPAPHAPSTVTLADMPLRRADYSIVAVASMEQIIGAGLSTVIGIMLPMMQMVSGHSLSSGLQGFVGACGLIGIAIGSAVIGRLSDRQGYLLWFRLCPAIILAGSLLCYFVTSVGGLIAGLLIAGVGVGGGYSLDSAYISELMPRRWRQVMVGVAKATSSLGFIGVAAVTWLILRHDPNPALWNALILIISVLSGLTLLLRIRWWESPKWLMARGQTALAERATADFLGKDVVMAVPADTAGETPVPWIEMFKGENLKRVIFSGIPWACEGLAVYGFGVFLPVLVMALGIGDTRADGISRIIESVETTAVVNFFILPGFVAGLLMMNRFNRVKMLYGGFIGAAVGLGLLLVAYRLHLPAWIMIAGFIIFEVTLNAGPHLITYIIPSMVYPVVDLGAGTGIAAMVGKVGAIVGVLVMPVLLEAGGMTLVLAVSIGVMLLGALVSVIYGRILKLL